MPIDFECPSCGKKFCIPDEHGGKRVQCKVCRTPFKAPDAARAMPLWTAPEFSPRRRILIACFIGSTAVTGLVIVSAIKFRGQVSADGTGKTLRIDRADALSIGKGDRRPSPDFGGKKTGADSQAEAETVAIADRPILGRSGTPEIRQAQDYYRAGRYQEAYDTVKAYIRQKASNAAGRLIQKGRKSIRPEDMVDTEAFFLQGILELLHPETIALDQGLGPVRLSKLAVDPEGAMITDPSMNNVIWAAESFRNAVKLDPSYRAKIAPLMRQAVESKLSAFGPDKMVEEAVKAAVEAIGRRDFARGFSKIHMAVSTAGREGDDRRKTLLDALGQFDRTAALEVQSRMQAGRPDEKAIRDSAFSRVWPSLLPVLEDVHEAQQAERIEECIPCLLPLYGGPDVDPRALKILKELIRINRLKYPSSQPAPPAMFGRDNKLESWIALARLAVAQAEKCLHPMLEIAGEDPLVCLALLHYSTKYLDSGFPARREQLSEVDADRINELFITQVSDKVLRAFDRLDPRELGKRASAVRLTSHGGYFHTLVLKSPKLLEREEVLCATVLLGLFDPDFRRMLGPFELRAGFVPTPEYYLKKFQAGEHAGAIRRASGVKEK